MGSGRNIAGALLGGSAVTGFGSSIGRDLYWSSRRNFGNVIFGAMFVFAGAASGVAGYYLGSLHRKGLLRTVFRWFVIVPLLVLVGLWTSAFAVFAAKILISAPPTPDLVVTSGVINYNAWTFAVGLATGLIRRRFQKRAHALVVLESDISEMVRAHNSQFFADHGLASLRDNELSDEDGNVLSPIREGEQSGICEFRVEGQRGKRAFLFVDNTFRAYFFSGVVDKADLARTKSDADQALKVRKQSADANLQTVVRTCARRVGVSPKYLAKNIPV